MEYVPGRDGFCEDDQIIRGKLPFSYSSSSSSQYKGLFPPTQIYDNHHRQMGSWLGNKFVDSEEDGSRPNEAAMEVSTENEDDGRRLDSEAAGAGNLVVEREHMFDKVVTPSDVGKLNRLVIPKQHAEKYFPLDSSSNEKGLLLNFEDRSGKPWRFRYSYWNSSQSYVMTKGWSRFVKEKKLDAGDVVSFQRGVGEIGKDRLYIDWRRRPDAPDPSSFPHHPFSFPQSSHIRPWSPLLFRPPPVNLIHHPYRNSYSNENGGRGGGGCYGYGNVVNPCSGSVIYVRSGAPQQVGMVQLQQGGVVDPMVFESVPVVHGRAAAKRLRLFGVNMECPISDSDDQSDILSSTSIPHASMAASQPAQLSPSSHPHLQLRLYNGTPLPAMAANDFLSKGKSSMSLDLDI